MNNNEIDAEIAKSVFGRKVLGLAYVYEDEMSCINIHPESEIAARYPDQSEQEVVRHRNLRYVMLKEEATDCNVDPTQQADLIHGHEEACLEPVEPYSTNSNCASNLILGMEKLGYEVAMKYAASTDRKPMLIDEKWWAEFTHMETTNSGNADGVTFAAAVSKAALFTLSRNQLVEEEPAPTPAPAPAAPAAVDTRPVRDVAPAMVLTFIVAALGLGIALVNSYIISKALEIHR